MRITIKSYHAFRYSEVFEVISWKDGCIFKTKSIGFILNDDKGEYSSDKYVLAPLSTSVIKKGVIELNLLTKKEKAMQTLVLTPAYGRDYKSKAAVLYDWYGGNDFIIENITHPYVGKPCSIRDLGLLRMDGFTHVEIRYAKKTKLVIVKL